MSISLKNCLRDRDSRAHSNGPSSIFHEYFIGCQKEENKLVLSPYLRRQQHRRDFGGAHFSAQKILIRVSQLAHKTRHTGIKEESTFYVFVVPSSSLEVSRHLMFFLLTLDGKVDVVAQRKREEKRHLSSFVASFLLPPPSSVGLRVPGGNRRQRRRGFSRPLLLSPALFLSRRREGGGRVPFPPPSRSLSLSLSREGGKNTHSDGEGEKGEKWAEGGEKQHPLLLRNESRTVCVHNTSAVALLLVTGGGERRFQESPSALLLLLLFLRKKGEWNGMGRRTGSESGEAAKKERKEGSPTTAAANCSLRPLRPFASVRLRQTDSRAVRRSKENDVLYIIRTTTAPRSLAGGCGRTTEL